MLRLPYSKPEDANQVSEEVIEETKHELCFDSVTSSPKLSAFQDYHLKDCIVQEGHTVLLFESSKLEEDLTKDSWILVLSNTNYKLIVVQQVPLGDEYRWLA